ncbi:MAG: hypothetical protein A2X79_08440 [Desulfuromonadaceae bacterium GWB2_53_15]|nr:MAG: hypothetical protein A2X79_08440 [Desulfuromonadaceae bacterium GWB2_53_15]
MIRGNGQQRQIAGALNGLGNLSLVLGAVTGDATGNNLAALGNEVAKCARLFVIDSQIFLGAEAANLPALEGTFLAWATWAA